MTATTELSEDGKLKLSVIHFRIRKAGKVNNVAERSRWPMSYHSQSADLCGLNLFIYSHICKKETFLMLAAAILYIMYILYTQYIPLPTHNGKGSSIYPQITTCSPAMTKATVDPSQGQGGKRLVCLTPQLRKGLAKRGSQGYSCPAHWLGDRTEVVEVLQGRELSLSLLAIPFPLFRNCYLCLFSTPCGCNRGANPA